MICAHTYMYLTICSIFFFHLESMLCRYSGLMSMAAKLKEDPLSPDRWHSITVEVRMGTMSTGEQKTNNKQVAAEQMLVSECEILSTVQHKQIRSTITRITMLIPSNITALAKTFHCSVHWPITDLISTCIFFILNYSPHSSNHRSLCIGQHKALDILCCLPIFTKILVVACLYTWPVLTAGEFADTIGHSNEHPGPLQVVTMLHMKLKWKKEKKYWACHTGWRVSIHYYTVKFNS